MLSRKNDMMIRYKALIHILHTCRYISNNSMSTDVTFLLKLKRVMFPSILPYPLHPI